MNTVDAESFLGRFAPFDALPPDELAAVAAGAREQRFAPGEVILLEDGRPADGVFVIREGAIELVHQGEAVDVLGPGETFGQPSLLSGLAPAFTVRARDESTCLVLPRELALTVFSGPAGIAYLSRLYRSRLVATGHVVHALPELGTVRAGDLVSRPPIFCEGSVTIRRAARTMSENRSSAILVRDGANIAILTDAVLRERVLAEGLSPENPVSRVTRRAVQVGPEQLAVDTVVEMLDAGTDHVVVVDAGREVVGVLSAADLAGLETRSPFALRHAILSARDEDELVGAAGRLQQVFLTLLDAGIGPLDVCRVLSLQVDTLTSRLIELALAARGPAPCAWAWLVLGSTARREFTLGSDVENALAYDDPADPGVDRFFAGVAADVTRGLGRCGFPLDVNGVLASEELWRMSAARWAETFRACLDSPDRSHLIRANVAFDFRQVAGALDVTPPLAAVLREAKEHPDLLRRLARAATDFKPPLGFRGHLVTRADGDGLDLKQGGTIPIANLARFHALSNGITISATTDRLTAVEEAGALDAETASALREGFEIVMRIRLDRHAEQIEAGERPGNAVDPGTLPPLTRTQLREAFRAIAHAQKKLSVYVPMGM
ncbi:MAG TPA: putative nucleotidyltransferase substrate binding domain-containing protein [Gaiellaceae bacterium]|nr:putative nucleotidyltransferase substrate binding domain-containing protein [Gaiellaceae bacterium]